MPTPPMMLPPELISHIMKFVILGPACFPIITGEPRLQLTQVCSAWKQIAFNTPMLWDFRFPASYYSQNPLKLASYWWSQCSESQLTMNIHPKPVHGIPAHSNQLLEKMVLPFTHRLKVICISLNCQGLARLLALPPHSFENLRKISIWLQDVDYDYSWDESVSALVAAPNLHSIYFSFPIQSNFKPTFPWKQLTQLVLATRIPASDFLVMVSQCTSLAYGSFHDIGAIKPETVAQIEALPNVPLHLPKLHRLSIHFRSSRFSHILSRLVLPNLIGLQFACNQGWADSGSAFINFLQPMKSSLQHLDIQSRLGGILDPPMDEAILESLSHLHSFVVPFHHYILPSTMERISKGDFLREVKRLQFAIDDFASVAEMLQTRRSNSLPPIGEVRVQCRSNSADVTEELEDLRSQGMTVDII